MSVCAYFSFSLPVFCYWNEKSFTLTFNVMKWYRSMKSSSSNEMKKAARNQDDEKRRRGRCTNNYNKLLILCNKYHLFWILNYYSLLNIENGTTLFGQMRINFASNKKRVPCTNQHSVCVYAMCAAERTEGENFITIIITWADINNDQNFDRKQAESDSW